MRYVETLNNLMCISNATRKFTSILSKNHLSNYEYIKSTAILLFNKYNNILNVFLQIYNRLGIKVR